MDRVRSAHGAVKRTMARGLGVSKLVLLVCCVCAAGVAGAVGLFSWMNRSPLFTVSSIRVEGTCRVAKEQVQRLSGLHTGMRMVDIRPASAQKSIMQNIWVRRASVSRHLPGTVVITVEERSPIALVAAGRVWYVDGDGMLLPLFSGTYSDLPVITGWPAGRIDSARGLPPAAFARVKNVVLLCRADEHHLLQRISQIDFSRDPLIRMKIDEAAVVVEINEDDFGKKLSRLARILESVQNGQNGRPTRINLCYENLAYVQ